MRFKKRNGIFENEFSVDSAILAHGPDNGCEIPGHVWQDADTQEGRNLQGSGVRGHGHGRKHSVDPSSDSHDGGSQCLGVCCRIGDRWPRRSERVLVPGN